MKVVLVTYLVAILSSCICGTASAQGFQRPPVYPNVDEYGVDMSSASITSGGRAVVSIGHPSSATLEYSRRSGLAPTDATMAINLDSYYWTTVGYSVCEGPKRYSFGSGGGGSYPGGATVNTLGDGATIAENASTVTLTAADGTTTVYSKAVYGFNPCGSPYYTAIGATTQTRPDGRILTWSYPPTAGYGSLMYSVTDNLGWQLRFEYQGSTGIISAVRAVNAAVDYCAPAAATCTYSQNWPAVQYSSSGSTYVETDPAGGQTTWSYDDTQRTRTSTMKEPGQTTPAITYTWRLVGFSTYLPYTATAYGGATRTYDWNGIVSSDFGLQLSGSSYSDTLGRNRTLGIYSGTGLITSDKNSLNQTTAYSVDSFSRVTGITRPEGNSEQYVYDARGNITSYTLVPKVGSGLTNAVAYATYPSTCANPKTCNKPTSVTDANGKTTDYTYDPVHGGILTKTLPADANGIRPQTRYEYSTFYAWLKNSGGGFTQASSPVWKLVRERYCRTTAPSGASCVGGAADEVVTDYQYQVGSASAGSNVLLMGSAVTADGTARRTCYRYDIYGRRISETQPKAGLATCL